MYQSKARSFSALAKDVERELRHSLSLRELRLLTKMYNDDRMSGDMIVRLVKECKRTFSRSDSPGRRVDLQDVVNFAARQLKECSELADGNSGFSQNGNIERSSFVEALGIVDRRLSKSEQEYINSWIAMGFTADAAAIAYDRAIIATGRLNWRYINAIMMSWHNMGIHNVADIELHDPARWHGAGATNNKNQLQDDDGPTEAELFKLKAARMRLSDENE